MNILVKLEREIERGLDELAKLKPSSDEYSDLSHHIEDLMERYAELKRINDEDQNQSKNRKSEQIHRYIGYGLTLVTLTVPLIFKWQSLKTAFVFEETGSLASPPARACLDDILKRTK